ncbi:MAG: ABC transporter ATP-binding protein [Candidatus Hodarchaeales archaeon]|jgi:ABC-type branched-subunit amino acid transport system ATPase component
MKDILKTEKLSKSFGGLKAVNNVNLNVEKSKIIGLIGPNGSGKSTVFNLITKILNTDEESDSDVRFEDKQILDKETYEIAQDGMIRTFQNTKILDKMTVLENMLVAAQKNPGESLITILRDVIRRFQGKKTWKEIEIEYTKKAMEILNFLEIDHLTFEKAGYLSGGQRKLLTLGRAIMTTPKIILLDEPVAGVNPVLSNKIFEKINSIRNEGTTFFIVEHNMDVIMESSDLIFVMNKGKIIAHDVPEVIQNDPKVLASYLGE